MTFSLSNEDVSLSKTSELCQRVRAKQAFWSSQINTLTNKIFFWGFNLLSSYFGFDARTREKTITKIQMHFHNAANIVILTKVHKNEKLIVLIIHFCSALFSLPKWRFCCPRFITVVNMFGYFALLLSLFDIICFNKTGVFFDQVKLWCYNFLAPLSWLSPWKTRTISLINFSRNSKRLQSRQNLQYYVPLSQKSRKPATLKSYARAIVCYRGIENSGKTNQIRGFPIEHSWVSTNTPKISSRMLGAERELQFIFSYFFQPKWQNLKNLAWLFQVQIAWW